MENCILCDLNDRDRNPTHVKNFGYWTLLVNYMQPTLGSSLVVLNRHIENFSDINFNEVVEYWRITRNLE